jgi:hypothetical protein
MFKWIHAVFGRNIVESLVTGLLVALAASVLGWFVGTSLGTSYAKRKLAKTSDLKEASVIRRARGMRTYGLAGGIALGLAAAIFIVCAGV